MSNQLTYHKHELDYAYPAVKRSKNNLIHSGLNADSINVDGWHLPGFQEKRDYCGQWGFFGCMNIEKHLDHKIFLKPFQKSCFRADCELCCYKWLGRESSKATKRIEKFEKKSNLFVKHLILSVPKRDYYKSKKELVKNVRKILNCRKKFIKKNGKKCKYSHNCEKDKNGNIKYYCLESNSGLIIYHPFRLKNDKWYYSPHFHILGFYPFLKEDLVKGLYRKHGYVIKNLGKRDTVFGTIYYQLSHAGIKKHNHALVYYGGVSYRQMKIEKNEDYNTKCPLCSDDLQELTPKYVSNHSCELKPDPIIMTVDYMIDFYDWVLKSSY